MTTEDTWPPLAEPFDGSGGLRVVTVGSVDEMVAIGQHFQNALGTPRGADMWARRRDSIHVYVVRMGDVPLSCGELTVSDGRLVVSGDRAHRNGPGSPETSQAVEEFAAAVNAGEVEIAYALTGTGFGPKEPAPAP